MNRNEQNALDLQAAIIALANSPEHITECNIYNRLPEAVQNAIDKLWEEGAA